MTKRWFFLGEPAEGWTECAGEGSDDGICRGRPSSGPGGPGSDGRNDTGERAVFHALDGKHTTESASNQDQQAALK